MSRPIYVFEGRFGRLVLAEALHAEPPHAHPEHRLLVKYDGADSQYRIAGQRVPFTREDLLFLLAGEEHENLREPGGGASRHLSFWMSGDWLRESFPAVFAADEPRPFPRAREAITPRIRRLADTLVIEILNDRFLSAERLEFMLQELVLSIVDTYLARQGAASSLWRGSRFTDSRIRQALALLRARPNKELNMDRLASQVGLSRSRFYALFQLCTGRSPRAYLDMLCVETAISKLSSSGVKIADLSAELGFSSQSNFTRFFLHQVGVSPSKYRRASTRREEPHGGTGDLD